MRLARLIYRPTCKLLEMRLVRSGCPCVFRSNGIKIHIYIVGQERTDVAVNPGAFSIVNAVYD